MIVKCKIESQKIIDGSYAMLNNDHLIQWDSDLNLLKNGKSMFQGCSNLNSFDAVMDSLISGNAMFWGCYNLNSFTSNLSSLSDGSYMFHLSGITSFNQSMNNLVNGDCMFYGSSIASFDGSLNSLRNGSKMFAVTPLQNVSSYLMLGSLITGDNMFLYVAGLDIESTNNILNALPDYKNNPIMTWNQSTNTYSEWNKIDSVIYPITQLAGGVGDEIGSTYLTPSQIYPEKVATITITFAEDYISSLSSEQIAEYTQAFVNTANNKGWTIITNYVFGGEHSPSVMTADGTVQNMIYVMKTKSDSKTANYTDNYGNYWRVDTAEVIIGSNVKYWSLFPSIDAAISEWGLIKL